jgi:hypothetical protein
LYTKLAMEEKNIFQFIFCFSVFQQLGLVEIKKKRIIIKSNKATELNKSNIYRKIEMSERS